MSGPLLDRIDLICHLEPVQPLELLSEAAARERSERIRERVVAARERQQRRLAGSGALCNADMGARLTRRDVELARAERARMLDGHAGLVMSARGHDRVLRLARTIADLEGRERVGSTDIDEALSYRMSAAWRTAA